MESFEGRIAVVTGGGTGMGRELARQLSAEGCHVAMCDVSPEAMAETEASCRQAATTSTTVSSFVADVGDEDQLVAFRQHVEQAHGTDVIHLLFNNAGIGGGGSFVADGRDEWERTFQVCWGGVYLGTRTFLPMLLGADEGHVVNTSSVNGLWASLGPVTPHTAYSAAKFAVRGFTEALITDFRVNAPHLRASVVMPGHIGTSIVLNSSRYLGRDPDALTGHQLGAVRQRLAGRGIPVDAASDDDLRQLLTAMGEGFRDSAPTTAAEAAATILAGVRAGEWRILVGDDAHVLDRLVRDHAEEAYDAGFLQRIREAGILGGVVSG
jgi:NAD(P)-dependent dehydrogenase (short-subunit alcohol dehydrogenase family)